ncbi:hypothetical protein RhiirC2_718999 [Rhizophagus irregularis]|uniref:Uncharacterized protein n=1 Tax=Rhizophagus irregularis TaxID=588596 RepID=A0A2N1MG40_9GLOM|nr:hypothetical protein RhiirC2_718999 [Rhizophagus irregularis]
MRTSYDKIKAITSSNKNCSQTQGRNNSHFPKGQHGQQKGNHNNYSAPHTNANNNRIPRRSNYASPNHMNNWDGPSNQDQANNNLPSAKGKQVETYQPSNEELLKRISHLETIIKDLSSQIKGCMIE